MEISNVSNQPVTSPKAPSPEPAKANRLVHNFASWIGRPFLFPQSNPLSKKRMGLDSERVERTRQDLLAIGGERVVFKTGHGASLEGMVFPASKFWALINKHFDVVEGPEGRVLINKEGRYVVSQGEDYSIRLPIDEEDLALSSLLERFGFSVGTQKAIPGTEDAQGLVISFPVPDGPVQPVDPAAPSQPTALLLGGNVGMYTFYREDIALYLQEGMNVVTFNYRGSDGSEGSGNGRRLVKDAETVYQYVRNQMHVEDQDLLIYGHCMGGTAAVTLAANHPGTHLIFDRGWSRLERVVTNRFPWMKGLAETVFPRVFDFDNASELSRVTGSAVIIEAKSDLVIGAGHVEELQKALPEERQPLVIRTNKGHNGSLVSDVSAAGPLAYALQLHGLSRRHV